MTFEDYAYYRTKNRLTEYVDSFCVRNWSLIDAFLQKNFTFDYNPDVDPFNTNDFFVLPTEPGQMAALVNSTIVPPLTKLLTTFAEGNEDLKQAQRLLDEFHAGVEGLLNGLNTLPAIITPMLKEGFASAGLDLDQTVDVVVGSMVFNYVGTTDNVTNDLFHFIPFPAGDLDAIRLPEADPKMEASPVYTVTGLRIPKPATQGVYICNGKKHLVR